MCDVTRSKRWDGLVVPTEVLISLPDTLRAEQRVFDSTGGLHGAGLFEADGTALVVREDIGRHNAVDKVVGARLLAGASPAAPVLCVSGRIGFEIVQKAVVAEVGVVAAVGAPSSLAVELATKAGLCTAGFVRGGTVRRLLGPGAPRRVTRFLSAAGPTVGTCACFTPPTGTWDARSTGSGCWLPRRRTSTT